jgi:hypothetical protein
MNYQLYSDVILLCDAQKSAFGRDFARTGMPQYTNFAAAS